MTTISRDQKLLTLINVFTVDQANQSRLLENETVSGSGRYLVSASHKPIRVGFGLHVAKANIALRLAEQRDAFAQQYGDPRDRHVMTEHQGIS
jgi:hypothetical protein